MKIPRSAIFWLAGSYVFILLPVTQEIPLWSSLSAGFLLFLKILVEQRKILLPPRWIRNGIGLCLMGATYLTFQTFNGPDAGLAALAPLSTLKFLESHQKKDFHILVLLGFFLIPGVTLFSQGIPATLYMFLGVSLLFASLSEVYEPSLSLFSPLKNSVKRILLALPVGALLFLVFPHLPAFWGLDSRKEKASTGFSDQLKPGSISEVINSDEIAFRVIFPDQNAPSPENMYFRGTVLWETDGFHWTEGKTPLKPRKEPASGQTIRQEIILEPHYHHWLFGLDQPVSMKLQKDPRNSIELLEGGIFRSKRTLYRQTHYFVESSSVQAPQKDSLTDRALRFPEGRNPKTQALAQSWKNLNESQLVEKAMNFFLTGRFQYTLTPPLLRGNRLDHFLFQTKSGFCEHYASALALLLRMSGIPSRVVMGYQGAKKNILGNYYIVRQRDAHAWTEAHLKDRGWVRLDPTSLVAPRRLELGGAAYQVSDLTLLKSVGEGDLELQSSWFSQIGFQAELLWDSLDTQWALFLTRYDFDFQKTLFRQMGFDLKSYFQFGVLTLAVIILFLALGFSWLKRQQTVPVSQTKRSYLRLCQKLSQLGYPKKNYEGARAYSERISSFFPQQESLLKDCLEHYEILTYGKKRSPQDLVTFQTEVEKLIRKLVRGPSPPEPNQRT